MPGGGDGVGECSSLWWLWTQSGLAPVSAAAKWKLGAAIGCSRPVCLAVLVRKHTVNNSRARTGAAGAGNVRAVGEVGNKARAEAALRLQLRLQLRL